MKAVTKNSFEQDVIKEKKVVLVDVWAPWCGPCRGMMPYVEAIAEETRWTRPIFWKGRDDFGVYYVIQATGNKDILKNAWVSYIIHRGQRKDQGGADMAWEAGKYREIFVINSDCMIYTKLAEAMGGGGHPHASGFKVEDGRSFEDVKTKCQETAAALLAEYAPPDDDTPVVHSF